MPRIRRMLIDLAVLIGVGLLLALIGPFGSFDAPFAWRLVSWTTLAVTGYLFYQPISQFVIRLSPRLNLPEWSMWVAGCLIATVPMTAMVWFAGHIPGRVPSPSLEAAVNLYFHVLLIGSLITALFYFMNRGKEDAACAADPSAVAARPEQPSAPPPFLDRLPPHLGRDLLALEMEDHYVRAHTGAGSAMILMRMRDAVAELEGLDGAQVHRSWWVAREAVTGTRREGRSIRLLLRNGAQAPVARGMAPELRAQGWF